MEGRMEGALILKDDVRMERKCFIRQARTLVLSTLVTTSLVLFALASTSLDSLGPT